MKERPVDRATTTMNHIRTLLTTLTLSAVLSSMAQLNVYKTYEDYVNKTPKAYPDATFKKWTGEVNSVLAFTSGGKEMLVECAGIWGFEYKGSLFRVSRTSK